MSNAPGDRAAIDALWALEATTDNVILVDREFKVTFINQAEVTGRWKQDVEIVVEEGMSVEGDERLLHHALTNLLDNACKFSPGGGRNTVGEEGGAFFVRDEGVGFDMQHAPKLFVAFERLVSQKSFEGTGVGLANVRRIVERHGGRVWAESEQGEGATFWFTLG